MQLARLDVPLGGSMAEMQSHATGRSKAGRALAAAVDLLNKYPTAKIVVIVDTHSLEESGFFIYTGSTPGEYKACCLNEVCAT
jgi:hypothetical protein